MYLTTDPDGPRIVPAARPDHSGVARLSAVAAAPAGRRASAISAPCSAIASDAPARIPAGRHRDRSAATTRPRPTPRCWRSGSKRPRNTAWPHRRSAWATSGCLPRLIAALDLAPAWKRRLVKDFNRKASLGARSRSARARAANGRRNTRACSRRSPAPIPRRRIALVTDLLSIAGIATVGGRSVAEIADRFLEQAALGAPTRLPRETRALIERFLAIAGDPDEAAGELRAARRRRRDRRSRRRSTCSRAAPAFWPRAASMCARSRFSTAFGRGLDYYTGFVFELHDPQPRRTARSSPAAAMTGCSTRLGAPSRSPRSALRSAIERARRPAEATHERAARPRRAVEGPPAGERRDLLRPRRARAGQAARRARLSRRDRRTSTASRSPISRRPRSPRSSRRARCISASPARIWCAR